VRLLKDGHGTGLGKGVDVAGAILGTAALMLGVYTVVEAGGYGWGSAHTLGSGTVAVSLLVAFLARQASAADPLLPLRVFRSRSVSGANLTLALMVAARLGFQFIAALYLQRVLGYQPAQVGLAFLPIPVVIATFSLGFSARLTTRFGARAVLLAGLTLIAVGLALLTRAPVHGHYAVDVLPVLLLLGIGAGLSLPAVTTLAMSGATPSDSGLASGLVNTTQQVAGALGIAALDTLATSRTEHLLANGDNALSALTGGYHLAFGIGSGLVIVAIILAVTVLTAAVPRHPRAVDVRGRHQVVRDLAGRAQGQRADSGPLGVPPGAGGDTAGQPHPQRVRGVGLYSDREGDGGVEFEVFPDPGQWAHDAEPGRPTQPDPPGPDGHERR
jgi:hypothetical protein